MGDDARELDQIHQTLRDGFAGIHERLDALNGRTRAVETEVAVLKDRDTRDPTARWTAVFAIVGGVVYQAAEKMFGK
jgi:hypothetical protein